MRVLFLDIDGVLNSYQSAHHLQQLRQESGPFPPYFNNYVLKNGLDMCPLAVSNLIHLLNEVKDLQIVISSTWRFGCDLKDLKALFPMSELIRSRIIDSTPSLTSGNRGDEIKRWVINSTTRVQQFAVLDDDTDMDAVEEHFFHVNHKVGFDYLLCEKVINYFT